MLFSSLLIAVLLGFTHPILSSIVRINALGDSITGSPGCWRALLWQNLQTAGVTNTDFVGTLAPQGCGFNYDGENDGHGGYLATGIASASQLPGWLAISLPDIVMMQLGTNDVWSSLPTATILAAYSTLVGQMRVQNPKMVVLVAQITPMAPAGCASCAQGVVSLNAAIPAVCGYLFLIISRVKILNVECWAAAISTATSPVNVVDCWTGFNTTLNTGDGVHPNESGNVILAHDWFAPLSSAIVKVRGGGGGGGATSTVTSAATISSNSKPVTASTLATKTSSSAQPTSTGAGSPLYGQCVPQAAKVGLARLDASLGALASITATSIASAFLAEEAN
ncbi:SGNH hydrolase [Drepanopeziza brunnea f. sp. 'multigermtubi' MB_m1]|uniref:SGNH hydrolase n=1 Tax=Marssonina brunnea f. sp. multigermtubi (strain MB_m1) TaxID=1072389 RepID=K1XFT3_MARBU|nr:SGNH hydrolase [Drepanopeziza brunnea f. sp. 'multigermtubi' MB_m1]EKD19633.1 SGNH hydrolase [Drepanopeziza brunnea f. sp. 'multigermtubi' MB_m1]